LGSEVIEFKLNGRISQDEWKGRDVGFVKFAVEKTVSERNLVWTHDNREIMAHCKWRPT